MSQYDVYLLGEGLYVVDIQSDLIRATGTRLVTPLVEPDGNAAVVDRLTPLVPVDGADMLLAIHLTTAVLPGQLRAKVGSLAGHADAIKAALDMLISGF